MPDAAQFTLTLFDSTGLGTSVQPPTDVPVRDAPGLHDTGADLPPFETGPIANGCNYVLDGDRTLARGWAARARDNIAAIHLSKEIEDAGRAPTFEEQARLLRFVGFGATELAQNCFPLPGATGYRDGWEAIGRDLADAVTPAEVCGLAACGRNMPITHPRALSGHCGTPHSIWGSPAAACSNRAWAPACSSPCCLRRCAVQCSSPASNTIR